MGVQPLWHPKVHSHLRRLIHFAWWSKGLALQSCSWLAILSRWSAAPVRGLHPSWSTLWCGHYVQVCLPNVPLTRLFHLELGLTEASQARVAYLSHLHYHWSDQPCTISCTRKQTRSVPIAGFAVQQALESLSSHSTNPPKVYDPFW